MIFKEFIEAAKQDRKVWKLLYYQMGLTFFSYLIMGLICYYFFGGLKIFGGSLQSLSCFIIIAFVIGSILSLYKVNQSVKNR